MSYWGKNLAKTQRIVFFVPLYSYIWQCHIKYQMMSSNGSNSGSSNSSRDTNPSSGNATTANDRTESVHTISTDGSYTNTASSGTRAVSLSDFPARAWTGGSTPNTPSQNHDLTALKRSNYTYSEVSTFFTIPNFSELIVCCDSHLGGLHVCQTF